MRSRILLRKAGLSTKTSSASTRALLSYSSPAHYPRNDLPANLAKRTRVTRRASTSSTRPQDVDSAPSPSGSDPPSKELVSSNGKNEPNISSQVLQVPVEQSFFWTHPSLPEPEPSTLPPPDVFEQVLNTVSLALHPQTQHKATYSTPSGPPTEPNLAIYCPIEGGNYVIDDTIRELARRTGSDVVVLDAVHIAAGEWGHFGRAASLIELPENPLHSPSPPTTKSDDDDDDSPPTTKSDDRDEYSPPTLRLQLVIPQESQIPVGGSSTKTMANAKAFFEMCINVQAPADAGCSNGTQRPRLIYIRDFPTLSSSWAALHPALLSAVRERRQGAQSRPTSPVVNPTAIVFGIVPPIFPPDLDPESPTYEEYPDVLVETPRPDLSEWCEEDHAEKARESRLQECLRKWELGDLQSEIHKLLTTTLLGPSPGGDPQPSLNPESPNSDSNSNSGLFRTSVLVPASRSLSREKTSRVVRRREINELAVRMAVGAIGGQLEARNAASAFTASSKLAQPPHECVGPPENTTNATKMWDEWGDKIINWALVNHIADQAFGRVISSSLRSEEMDKPSLSAVSVSWDHVCGAWADRWASRDFRRAWVQQPADESVKEVQQKESLDKKVNDIVELVKNGDDREHERRLLGCIVDSLSMPTSFAQVHLPPHTIDSVRTMVSLPLLHPAAFQQGILKEHSMRGCLLFGPPGTGKTMVVRALAKEAGCSMMSISPSDVNDLYVGEGEKLMRAVFSLARRLAPCVIFIDEIDTLFGARSFRSGDARAHGAVMTEFMQEMDGLKTSNDDNVIVIGATNRPFDLDDAVLRRLPRRLLIDLPGESEREEIMKILLRNETLSPDVNLKALAQDTPMFSGSDLKHVCVSAALDAVKENVSVPWLVDRSKNDHQDTLRTSDADKKEKTPRTSDDSGLVAPRILRPHHFAKALKEITPSASESSDSLTHLRNWNDEFGEGRKRTTQVWGKGRFGFTGEWHSGEGGSVVASPTGSDQSGTPSAE